MTCNARCSMQRLAALAIVTSLLAACATDSSEPQSAAACPPVVEYSRALQLRAASELSGLPEGSAIAEMLSDYAVMRDQARACRRAVDPIR